MLYKVNYIIFITVGNVLGWDCLPMKQKENSQRMSDVDTVTWRKLTQREATDKARQSAMTSRQSRVVKQPASALPSMPVSPWSHPLRLLNDRRFVSNKTVGDTI